MTEFIFINGSFKTAELVKIDPSDRGLLLGDGVFDTMLAVNNVLAFAEAHYDRLKRHADLMDIPVPFADDEFKRYALTLLQKNGCDRDRFAVRTTLTRGPAERGLKLPAKAKPTIMMRTFPAPLPKEEAVLIVAETVRRNEGSPLSKIKSLNYLDNVLALREALRHRATDAILLNNAGHVCCATTSNIFAVLDGQWVTPPLADGVLDGIMRAEICREKSAQERPLTVDDLKNASEIHLTNSLTGLRRARLISDAYPR